MLMKKLAAKIFAAYIHRKNQKWIKNPISTQEETRIYLQKKANNTAYGKDHKFSEIQSYEDFKASVPVVDYEGIKPYVERVVEGESDVLWPGRPLYYAKTSGTTSGAKYIPITPESMPTHISAARNAILNYIHQSGNTAFVTGKQIFLQGSPEMEDIKGVKLGRLSGIAAHYVPSYLLKNRMPTWETNCIEDWETKVDTIVDETLPEKMSVIAGIPSWVQMYFERLIAKEGKAVGDIFPDFQLFIHGGVNYKPYVPVFEKLIGRRVDQIELFPASEGFFAYQDQLDQEGLLLLLNQGIFYEFIPVDSFGDPHPKRIWLDEVELGVNYVLILNTTAGLWGYNIGDTVRFVSKDPYRIVVTGRLKHYISAFGEHVIGKEVETAMENTLSQLTASVKEFTVAPQIKPAEGLPYHEWLVEFDNPPADMLAFEKVLDAEMQQQNVYYQDLIQGKVLRPVKITALAPQAFQQYMKSIGKLGGQNKVPRLSNDRKIADALQTL
ncbi:MAG: GH3 auxin-responsive promoter family protein [Flavobacteriaceae bacterium]